MTHSSATTVRHGLAVAIALALSALAGPLLALASAAPAGPLLLVISAPDPNARSALIRAAGGDPVGPQQTALAGLATSPAPDFAERLRDAGAWFVLDGRAIARLCGVPT